MRVLHKSPSRKKIYENTEKQLKKTAKDVV